MRRLLFLVILCPALASAQWLDQTSGTQKSLRGLHAVSGEVAWASGAGGVFTRTVDKGATWRADVVKGAENLDFRDLHAFDADHALLMATSGRIYSTSDGGVDWKLVYENTAPGIFLDCIAFWDARRGIALGDPMDGRFLILLTDDAGQTWHELPAEARPEAGPGEAAFAASGTCVAVQGKMNAWFVSGGAAARVFRSTDGGKTWQAAPSPIPAVADSGGIFAVAFRDALHGVIVGGDYKEPEAANANAAYSSDGGKTWTVARKLPGGYRSGVVFVPGSRDTYVTVGSNGSEISFDGGRTWRTLDGPGFNSVSFVSSAIGWAAGDQGAISVMQPLPQPQPQAPSRKK